MSRNIVGTEKVGTDYPAISTAEYEFVRYQPGHKSEVMELFAQLWPPDKELNSAYFDWKYCRNPYVSDPLIFVALHRREVVCVFCWLPGMYRAGDREQRYLCVAGSDAVTRQDHRRRGLHDMLKNTSIEQLEAESYQFEISMSNNEHSRGSALKWGAMVTELTVMQRVPSRDTGRLRRIVRTLPVLSTICRRFNEDASRWRPTMDESRPFQVLDRNYEGTDHFGRSHTVLEERPRPREMALLAGLHSRTGRIGQVRDERFYAWRYENPFSAYRFLFWEKTGLQGYLVLRQPAQGRSNAAFVVDWEAAGTGVFREMLDVVIRYGGFGSIGIWSVGIDADLMKVLTRCGFRPTGKTTSSGGTCFCPSIVARPFRGADEWRMAGRDVREISNWDLRPIYSDAF